MRNCIVPSGSDGKRCAISGKLIFYFINMDIIAYTKLMHNDRSKNVDEDYALSGPPGVEYLVVPGSCCFQGNGGANNPGWSSKFQAPVEKEYRLGGGHRLIRQPDPPGPGALHTKKHGAEN